MVNDGGSVLNSPFTIQHSMKALQFRFSIPRYA